MASESALSKDIRAALNATGLVRLVRNNVGVDTAKGVRYGLGNGSPDLVGVLTNGVCFCIEVKTSNGRVSKDQEAWWRAARQWGVKGGVARSVQEALDWLSLTISVFGPIPPPRR